MFYYFGHLIEVDSCRTCLLCLADVTRHNDLKVHYYVVLLCSSYVVACDKHSFLSVAKQCCTECADRFTVLASMSIWITLPLGYGNDPIHAYLIPVLSGLWICT